MWHAPLPTAKILYSLGLPFQRHMLCMDTDHLQMRASVGLEKDLGHSVLMHHEMLLMTFRSS